jgi:hypothetical protein
VKPEVPRAQIELEDEEVCHRERERAGHEGEPESQPGLTFKVFSTYLAS